MRRYKTTKIKSRGGGNHRLNIGPILLIMLMAVSLVGEQVSANTTAKTMTLALGESTSRTQTKTVTIPNVRDVRIISVSTGTADVTTIGNEVTVTAKNGAHTRREQTGGTYTPGDSKEVTNQSSANYNKDGYTGTLDRYLHSGSYTPAESKEVTNQSSANYNSGGFSGTLTKYVHSGSYTPADSKTATGRETGTVKTYYKYIDGKYKETRWTGSSKGYVDYNSGGYSGRLSNKINAGETNDKTYPYDDSGNEFLRNSFDWWMEYSGTVTKPESDTRVYRYKGTVTKPASDTRVYRYKGTVTKPPSDTRTYQDYYEYTVEIEYFDNVSPTISINNPSQDLILSGGSTITIMGMATDPDQNTIKVQANIGGIVREMELTGPITDGDWELIWYTDEVPEGKYTDIKIKVTDGIIETTATYTGTITVDRTRPKMEITVKN